MSAALCSTMIPLSSAEVNTESKEILLSALRLPVVSSTAIGLSATQLWAPRAEVGLFLPPHPLKSRVPGPEETLFSE